MNARDAEAERAFGTRAVAAVSELGIAMHHVIEDLLKRGLLIAQAATSPSDPVELHLDGPLSERVSNATDSWRQVLAEAQFFSSGPLAEAFYAFDRQRQKVVESVNEASGRADLEAALRECANLREHHAGQIYRLLQVEKVRGRARTFHLAHVLRLRHFAKTLTNALQAEIDRGMERVNSENPGEESDDLGAPLCEACRSLERMRPAGPPERPRWICDRCGAVKLA